MACEKLEDFQNLDAYRKSFNGDLQAARSKPVKLAVLEGFKFDKGTKGWCLVLGHVETELLTQLKGNASKLAAAGTLKLEEDGKLVARLKSGKLEEDQLKKALELAQVRRGCEVLAAREEREADADEEQDERGEDLPLPGKLKDAGEAVAKAVQALEGFFRERVEALQWHESEIKTQQDAQSKIAEINKTVEGLEKLIEHSNTKAKDLRNELKALGKDPQVAKYSKAQLTKLSKAIELQEATALKLTKQIENQKRKLPELELLARKHGASRHGAQTDLALQARRAATGGVTPDQSDNVHGASQGLVDVKWNRTTISIDTVKGKVVNKVEVVKHLITEMSKLDKVATDTASKFHSPELEREAVTRAIAMVKRDCVWTEVEEGSSWKPLDSVTVYVGPPAKGPGWGFSMSRQSDPKKTVEEANQAIEAYRSHGNTDTLLKALDVLMTGVTSTDERGKSHTSVPMVKSCRVTLGRTSSGWTSITHFPDATATPPGWTLTGSGVRKDARSPRQIAPAGRTP